MTNPKQHYHKINKRLSDEITSLQNDRNDLMDGYIELHSILNGIQRSLIPIISKGLLISQTSEKHGSMLTNLQTIRKNSPCSG